MHRATSTSISVSRLPSSNTIRGATQTSGILQQEPASILSLVKMWWFYGGDAVIMTVCAALMVAAHPRFGQHMDDDSSVDAEVFACLARYVSTAHQPGVLLVHNNHADVVLYVARVRSPLTIFNAGPLKTKSGYYSFRKASTQRILEWPYSLVVVLVATKEDFRFHDTLLMHNTYRNAQPRYLVVCQEPRFGALTRGIFSKFSARYGLYNVAVLTANDTRVHTCYPPGGAYCKKPWPHAVLGTCQQLSLDKLYAHTEPIHPAGCRAYLSVNVPPPCVLNNASLSEQPLVAGYEAALANIILKRLHMKKRIDAGYFGEFCISSFPYHTDTARWYVPLAGPRAQWKSVVLVFQAPLWAAVLAFFLLNTLAWWLVRAGSYVECVLDSLRTLLNGSVPLPRSTSRRFLVMSWTLCALVLGAAYQSQLLSVLLTPVAGEQPITNEQQLFASDMPVDIKSVGHEIHKMHNYKQIKVHERKFGDDAEKSRAVLQFGVTAKYRAREQSNTRGKPILYAFEEPAMHVLMCVKLDAFPSAMPPINRLMRRLMENGILAKFMRDMDFSGYMTGGRARGRAAHHGSPGLCVPRAANGLCAGHTDVPARCGGVVHAA